MQKETSKKRNYIIGIDLVTILYIKENLKIIKLKYYFKFKKHNIWYKKIIGRYYNEERFKMIWNYVHFI